MIERILQCAVDEHLFDDAGWAVLYDLDVLRERFEALRTAFPDDALHAVAIKANPLVSILERLVDAGAGLEAASSGEIALARRSGVPADRIVYDSPAKTTAELETALEAGIRINADNLEELKRIDACNPPVDAPIGIRLNPMVGPGDIEATSVATKSSKFGVPIDDRRTELLEAFDRYEWLDGLHVHTGSQGCGLALLVEGVARIVDFALEVENELGDDRIETVDIGGGLPVAYRPDESAPTAEEYAEALREKVPALFERPWRIVTEFGRWVHAPCGVAASRVEYVKPRPTGPVATIHFGADLLLRTAYRPDQWYHRATVHDPTGRLKSGDNVDLTVAGPLCFSDDLVVRDRQLPRPETGDLVAVHDVGAYTFSMWSRYCSRPFPPVFGVRRRGDDVEFEELHGGESNDEVAQFWEGK